jgi:hypothetical protein
MCYSLHEIDRHDVVATTVAADRDEALEWFSEKLPLIGPEGLPYMPSASPRVRFWHFSDIPLAPANVRYLG